jgi:amino acid adenylation domain-containing protein
MTNFNLSAAVHRHASGNPGALAISCEGTDVTYGEAAARASRIGWCLRQSRAWPGPGGERPRVGVLASRSIGACLAVLGASWAGATYVPIGLKLPEDRILTMLSLCNLSALVADDLGARLLSARVLAACPPLVIAPNAASLPVPRGVSIETVDLDALPASRIDEPAPTASGDTAYIIFTSGTTGVPKGVVIPAGAIQHFVRSVTELLGIRSSDRALGVCELSFDVSLHDMFSIWHAGASAHLLPATRVMNAVRFARASGLTIWNSVPSLVGLLRQVKALGPGVLPGIRLTTFGGEHLTEGVVAAWRSAAPNSEIYNIYGPTETTVYCLTRKVTQPTPLTPGRDVVSIGQPLPGTHAAVMDPQGNFVRDGEVGELALAGVQLSDGYLNAPELTAARFPLRHGRRWSLTGDFALRDASGQFHCLGRMDNQVKVLGQRIELDEVDAHLRVVTNCSVVGTIAWPLEEGTALGLVAFVGAGEIDAEEVIRQLRTRLPAYMVPSQVIAVREMPFNGSGKVDRRALRERLERELV